MDNNIIILIKYSFLALLATTFNLIVQYVSFIMYSGESSIYWAMVLGTLTGLVSKYFMDKHYIFKQGSSNTKKSSPQFFLYSMTGVLTTCLFWGTELSFDILFESENAKYVGAALGLGLGYYIKYQLDKKYVFKEFQL
jgi:putative flippase GtrA